nr:hypothetical protein GCM10020093_102260 [Planobispora longispora]
MARGAAAQHRLPGRRPDAPVRPGCARAADALLSGELPAEDFDKILTETGQELGDELTRIAADPLFREAITWQNRGALVALDALARGGGATAGGASGSASPSSTGSATAPRTRRWASSGR